MGDSQKMPVQAAPTGVRGSTGVWQGNDKPGRRSMNPGLSDLGDGFAAGFRTQHFLAHPPEAKIEPRLAADEHTKAMKTIVASEHNDRAIRVNQSVDTSYLQQY